MPDRRPEQMAFGAHHLVLRAFRADGSGRLPASAAAMAGAVQLVLSVARAVACAPSAWPDVAPELRTGARLSREIGRESCRERVCQYGVISVVAVTLKKKKKEIK